MGNRSIPEDAECQHYMEIGLLELEQGSIFVARKNFEHVLEKAKTSRDNLCKGLALLKLAEVHHTNCDYEDAENRYRQAAKVFAEESAADKIFESKIGLAYLYLDWEKYEEASKIGDASRVLDEIKSQDWNPNQMGKLALVESEVLMHHGQYIAAGKLLAHALGIVGRELPLHLHIKKAKAYASFRNGRIGEAKEEYEEALKLASELNLPHEEMLIYQDLMFMEYELGAFTSYRERRERSREKQDNNYTKIERYHSAALNYLRKKDYRQAHIYLVRENRAYRRAGNLFGHGLADNLASLFSESQEYEKALQCYIKLGDTDKIQQISTLVLEWIEPKSIHGIFRGLLKGLEEAPVIEKTGVAAALGSLFEISPNELLIDIVRNLLDLTDGEYSFSRNRDVKRTALKSLEKYIRGKRVPEQVINEVLDKLVDISDHEEPFVREHVAKCFNAFLDKVPELLQEKVARHLATQFDIEESDTVRQAMKLAMANLALHFSDPWKQLLVATLKRDGLDEADVSNEVLGYLAWLGESIPEERIEFALNGMMNNLDAQANYTDRAVRSLWVGLDPLGNMKKQIPDRFKTKLVEKMILALQSERNLAYNKRLIIQAISVVSTEFSELLRSKLWHTLLAMAEGGLSEIDSGNYESENRSIFGVMTFTSLEDIIGDLIYALAKINSISNTHKMTETLNSLLLRSSGRKEMKIRQSAAHCFQYLEILSLESQLTIFSLLFDVDDVAGQAIQSVARLSDKVWDKTVLLKIVEKLALHANTGKLGTKVATAYALNQLAEQDDLSEDVEEKIQRARKTLSSDKFYRVRREVSQSGELTSS